MSMAVLPGLCWVNAVRAQLYVGVQNNNTIAEYNATTGAEINGSLVSGVTVSGKTGVITEILPSGNDLYATIVNVSSGDVGAVGEYNATTGAAINSSLITGLSLPGGLAISGNNLYVLDRNAGTIGEYNATTGAAIHSTLVSGLSAASPLHIVLSGNSLYVVNFNPGGTGSVGEYNATTGAAINSSLVSGLGLPEGIAISGNNLYIASDESGTPGVGVIGEYNATTGAAINSSLVSVPGFGSTESLSLDINVSGNVLYIANQGSGAIGEYNATTGAAIGSGTLISGLNTSEDEPGAIGIEPVPEPSTWVMLAGGLGGLLAWRLRRHLMLA